MSQKVKSSGGLRAQAIKEYRSRASELCRLLDTHARSMIAFLDSSPYGAQVSRDVIDRAIHVLTDEVMDSIPVYLCPNHPHPIGCETCGGKRWLSQREDEELQRNRDLTPIWQESLPQPQSSPTCPPEEQKSSA